MELPNYDECEKAVADKRASKLQTFIYYYEPQCNEADSIIFRKQLSEVLIENKENRPISLSVIIFCAVLTIAIISTFLLRFV